MYLDTCIGDTCIDIGIDLTSLWSIMHRYRFTYSVIWSIAYWYWFTKKLCIDPISGYGPAQDH